MSASAVKRIILLFWALWLGLVAAGNFFSLLKALRLVDRHFVFASNNFELVRSFMAGYHLPQGLIIVAFAAVVIWQWLTVGLFLRAVGDIRTANAAFGAGLALFAAFLVAGEFFLRYDFEAIHMRIVIGMIVSWMAIGGEGNGNWPKDAEQNKP